jgi:restriction system protein
MAVPDFQSWFLPLLQRLADGNDHAMNDLYEQLADDKGLSPEDRAELLKSGGQFVYQNRIGWARTYLKKAGLVESPGRGLVRITPRGREVLAERLPKLSVSYLRRYPEFVEFHTYRPEPSTENAVGGDGAAPAAEETPQDALERAHDELRRQLAEDLLDRVLKASPSFFERVVIDLLLQNGLRWVPRRCWSYDWEVWRRRPGRCDQ